MSTKQNALPGTVLARWNAEDWNDNTMTASKYRYESAEGPIELTDAETALYSWGTCEDNLTGGSQRGWLRASLEEAGYSVGYVGDDWCVIRPDGAHAVAIDSDVSASSDFESAFGGLEPDWAR